jgi:beta-glucanase (GH16 family)
MTRLSSSDVNKQLELIDRHKEFLLAEKAGVTVGVSIEDVKVHPTALEARLKIKLTGNPRNTVIGSYGTRNGVGTNAGTHYTKTTGKFIFQPDGPIVQEMVVPLKGNSVAGNTIEISVSNTLYGGKLLTPNVVRIRFSDTVPQVQDDWNLVYETDFVNGFEYSDTGLDAAGEPCWSSRLAHGRTQPNNQELGLYADPVILPGTNPFPIIDGKRRLRSERLTNTWQGQTYQYTAALLRSNRMTPILPGYKVEARIAMPLTGMRGAWPAIWFLPRDGSWPPEIDVMEWAIGSGSSPWVFNTTQHWTEVSAHRSAPYAIDIRDFGATEDMTQFHTYGTVFGEKELEFYFDGVKFITMENQSPGREWYALLNIAMGGSWPGSPTTATQFPCDVILDWIRFYEPN